MVRTVTDTMSDDGTIRSILTVLERPTPDRLRARIRYEAGGAAWEQEFVTQELDDDALPDALAAAGLQLGQLLTDSGDWFTAEARD